MVTVAGVGQHYLERAFGQADRGPLARAGKALRGVPLVRSARVDSGPLLRAVGVEKSYGHTEVLGGIDLEVHKGQVVCLLGPSGAGKSTFLRCINHLETIDAGQIWVDGEPIGFRQRGGKLYELRERDVARQRRDIGMVFQRFNLLRAPDRAGERRRGPDPGARGQTGRSPQAGARSCSTASGSRTAATPTRRSCPAGSSSASRSPGRWR